MGGQEIDIDQLIAKLLEIPNEELLDTLLNLSPDDSHSLGSEIDDQQSEELDEDRLLINFDSRRDRQFSSDGVPSGVSSGILTPQAQSFSTPVQIKIF